MTELELTTNVYRYTIQGKTVHQTDETIDFKLSCVYQSEEDDLDTFIHLPGEVITIRKSNIVSQKELKQHITSPIPQGI